MIGVAALGMAALALGRAPDVNARYLEEASVSSLLRVHTARRQKLGPAFRIRGSFGSALLPGNGGAIGLSLRNPHNYALRVRRLKVYLKAIHAPHATTDSPCSTTDFRLTQFKGQVRFRLAPHTTRTLAQLHFPRSAWPQLWMLNRPVNQDGCKGAELVFDFVGRAYRAK